MEYDTLEELLNAHSNAIHSEIYRWNLKPQDKEDAYQAIALKLLQSFAALMKSAADTNNPRAYIMASVKRTARQEIMEEIVGYSHRHSDQKSLAQKMRDAAFMVGTMSAEPDAESYGDWYNKTGSIPSAEHVVVTAMSAINPWQYIDKLSDRQRLCMTLRYYNELMVPEVAAKTGYTYKQVEAALAHGMKNVRAMMGVEYKGKRGTPKGVNRKKPK